MAASGSTKIKPLMLKSLRKFSIKGDIYVNVLSSYCLCLFNKF